MAYPHGRAKVDARSPRAFAVCDRCGFLYNHKDLHWQYDFRGRSLANLRILVCDICEDTPQPQLKPRIIPPDPMPIMNARPERYCQYESNTRVTQGNTIDFWTGLPISGGDTRITQSDTSRSTQITGESIGGLDNTPGTSFLVPGNDELGPNQGLPCGFSQIPQTGPLAPYLISVTWFPTIQGDLLTWGNQVLFWGSQTLTWGGTAGTFSNANWTNNLNGTVAWYTTVPSTSPVMD